MTASFVIAHPDPFTVTAAQLALRDAHYTVHVARDGLDALDQALDRQPNAIVLGLDLVGLGGLDVARALRAIEPTRRIPVLFVTRDSVQAELVSHAGLGLVEWIGAPLNLGHFRDQATRLLHAPRENNLLSARLRVPADAPPPPIIFDPLTGLYERPYALHRLSYEAARAARYHSSLACLVARIDQFEAVVRREGRVAADRVLIQVADVVLQAVRSADLVGRLDTDCFLILAPHTAEAGAIRLAERIQQRMAEHQAARPDAATPITLSISTAYTTGEHVSDALALLGKAEAGLARLDPGEENQIVAA